MAKRFFAMVVSQNTVQEKLGSKMDYKAGFSAAAVTVASTAAFVKYESGNLKEDMRSLRADIKKDIQKLDNNRREDFGMLESKMDQILFHIAGIQQPSKVCQTGKCCCVPKHVVFDNQT